jgi:hypothetical protein
MIMVSGECDREFRRIVITISGSSWPMPVDRDHWLNEPAAREL